MKPLFRIVSIAALLAWLVVILGAYTRLTHAGLGCPDWPGCYGHLTAPATLVADQSTKAWTEMVHRYLAGSLGLCILAIGITAWSLRRRWQTPVLIPSLLIGLVLFQAALGRWTVTWKLLPTVVMGHLLGGLAIFSLLVLLRLQLSRHAQPRNLMNTYQPWVILGLILVFCQIALGGWVSANYSGLACLGFPLCNGLLVPDVNWGEAFNLVHPIGQNYQGGILGMTARITIQFAHRIGAVVTASYLIGLCIFLLRDPKLKLIASAVIGLVSLQFLLGVINVTHLLPLANAVAHNAVAALLLGVMASLTYAVCAKEAL